MFEKLEECPHCGCDDKRWKYDMQQCQSCGPIHIMEGPFMGHSGELASLSQRLMKESKELWDLSQEKLRQSRAAAQAARALASANRTGEGE